MITTSFMCLRLQTQHITYDEPSPERGTRLQEKTGPDLAPVRPRFFCLLLAWILSQVEIDFDIQRHIDRYSIPHARFESPLFERLNGIFVQAKSKTANNAKNIHRAVSLHDSLKNDSTLIPRFSRFFGV